MGGVYYSQHGEDVFVLNMFNNLGMKTFSYIDIGANEPYKNSNTALLYENGCRGYLVDANPVLAEMLKKERPGDTVVNVGIGGSNGSLPFYMVDSRSGRNSFSKELVDKFLRENPGFSLEKIINVPTATLDDLVEKYCKGVFPDYLSMDIEGLDEEAIKASVLLNKETGPKMLCLEITMAKNAAYRDSLMALVTSRGYVPAVRLFSNVIFVREDLYNLSVLGISKKEI